MTRRGPRCVSPFAPRAAASQLSLLFLHACNGLHGTCMLTMHVTCTCHVCDRMHMLALTCESTCACAIARLLRTER
jgi:hypothetical protein